MTGEHRERIGKQIESIRNHKGMTRRTVANAMKKDYQWIWNIETGRRVPSVSAAMELAALFGVSVDSILNGDPDHVASV